MRSSLECNYELPVQFGTRVYGSNAKYILTPQNNAFTVGILFSVFSDLGRMYSLVSRVPIGMALLRKKFESHVHSQGLSAIAKCGDTVMNVSLWPES